LKICYEIFFEKINDFALLEEDDVAPCTVHFKKHDNTVSKVQCKAAFVLKLPGAQ
jgi:hypothetical protein